MPVMGDTPMRRVLATLAFFSALLGSPGLQGGDDVDLRNCEQGSASSCDRYLDSHATGKERAIALNARGLIYSNCFKYPNLCRDKNAPFVNTLKSKGFIYRPSEWIDNAIEDFTGAIKLNPTYVTALYNRSIAYSRKDDFENAFADLTRALEIAPSAFNLYAARADAYLKARNPKSAEEDAHKSLELKPENSLAKVILHEIEQAKASL
jgi:tetratricopeptide (TPR) repeat protein